MPTAIPYATSAREINGGTLLTGIFGDPVEHSLSPAMHNAAYAALRLDRAYVPFHVRPENLAQALRSIAALGMLGVNLTVPHKERALRFVDTVSAEARTLGAINCVINRRGRLMGDNTDARGLERDLRRLEVSLADKTAVIIGAGGGAAAALLALRRLGARRTVVVNRTVARACGLTRRFKGGGLEAAGLDALAERALMKSVHLVINATSIGLGAGRFPAVDYGSTPGHCVFYDLLYAPRVTEFLELALDAGRPIADGTGMLLEQGVLAFQLFNRQEAPHDTMRRALCGKLGRATLAVGSPPL